MEESRGKAVKIIAQLLPKLREGEQYRVIFMERTLKTIIVSQSKMLDRLGKGGGRLTDKRLAKTYVKQVHGIRKLLSDFQAQVHILSVNYSDALENPGTVAAQVNKFLGGGLDEQAMAATIDVKMCHQNL